MCITLNIINNLNITTYDLFDLVKVQKIVLENIIQYIKIDSNFRENNLVYLKTPYIKRNSFID